jgi:hypothetical protein
MISKVFRCRIVCTGVSLLMSGAALGCATEHSREEVAVREFHQRLEQNRADLIYQGSSDFLKKQLSEGQFRKFLAETRSLGALQETERAHYTRTKVAGDADLVVAFYNTRYEKAACLESFSWRVEPEGLKLANYSCAPNMRVSCPGGVAGSACETSPVPQPGIAGLP